MKRKVVARKNMEKARMPSKPAEGVYKVPYRKTTREVFRKNNVMANRKSRKTESAKYRKTRDCSARWTSLLDCGRKAAIKPRET